MSGTTAGRRASAAAQTLALERLVVDVYSSFLAVGVPALLLKGPSFARWLYDDRLDRLSSDCDFLVPPGSVALAEEVLASLGFAHDPLDDIPGDKPWHAHAWEQEGKPGVDLHRTLIGAAAAPDRVWEVLSRDAVDLKLPAGVVRAASIPGRILHVCLHAAQDGPLVPRHLDDLDRAIERAQREEWRAAVDLAADIDALPAMVAGLRVSDRGAALARELGLPELVSTGTLLRSSGAPAEAIALEWAIAAPGAVNKIRFVVRKLFPPVGFLKAWSPIAARGGLWIGLAYVVRVGSVLARTPRGVLGLLKGRRRRAEQQSKASQ